MEIQRAAEFGWVIGLFILISFVFDVIKKQKQRRQEEEERLRRPPPQRTEPSETVTGAGDTQAEGRGLEDLLRGLEQVMSGETPTEPARLPPMTKPRTPTTIRTIDRYPGRVSPPRSPARGPTGRRPDRQLESHEDIEERESLGVEPEVRSLEVSGRTRDIKAVDQDETFDATIKRRLDSVQARSQAHTKVDHQQFHKKIERQPADNTGVARRYSVREMQKALVWREILGPPKGMEGL